MSGFVMFLLVPTGRKVRLSGEQAVRLSGQGIIELCDECDTYHLCDGYSWKHVSKLLNIGVN